MSEREKFFKKYGIECFCRPGYVVCRNCQVYYSWWGRVRLRLKQWWSFPTHIRCGWISVKQQLPSMWDKSDYRSKTVWVTDGETVWKTAYHVTGKRWMEFSRITHWMPMKLPSGADCE